MIEFRVRFVEWPVAAILSLCVCVSVCQRPAAAQTVPENGDAGALPVSAQIETGTAITTISGEIDGSKDIDMYRITIDDPPGFSATTSGGSGTIADTRLYLFDGAGMAVYFNDDIVNDGVSPPNYLSTLPMGHASGPSVAGDYFLAVVSYPKFASDGSVHLFLEPDFDPVEYDDVLGPNPGTSNPISAWAGATNQFIGTYQITITGVNGTLPIELVYFRVRLDGHHAIADWTTAAEDNAGAFEIQARRQGQSAWESVGSVVVRGPGSDYSYRTGRLPTGKHAFRLRFAGPGGAYRYSEVIEVAVTGVGELLLSEVTPNPLADEASIVLTAGGREPVVVSLFDLTGRKVMDLFSGLPEANQVVNIRIDASNLAPGPFFVTARSRSAVQTRTLFRVR